MRDHYHRCGDYGRGGCGLVWAHPDAVVDLPVAEYQAAHMCPRCKKGPWREKVNPKKITIDQVREAGACQGGVREFRNAFGEEVAVTRENVLKAPDMLVNHGAFFVENFLKDAAVADFREADRYIVHTFRDNRCMGCQTLLLAFVDIYNRE